ncbi:MAG: helix-turn-helix domain-containing protein [Armatimonadetes bacterium]|nr:helix-turn-helix domain-containing protein [Armatimonadota bacterium]
MPRHRRFLRYKCKKANSGDYGGLQLISSRYCTEKERAYGRTAAAFWNDPPEYDTRKEHIQRIESAPRKVLIYTKLDSEWLTRWGYVYTLLRKGDRWLIDNKKVLDQKERQAPTFCDQNAIIPRLKCVPNSDIIGLEVNTVTFGEKIRNLRRQQNWSQDELGAKIGAHGRHVSKYERNLVHPSLRTLQLRTRRCGTGFRISQ